MCVDQIISFDVPKKKKFGNKLKLGFNQVDNKMGWRSGK